MEQLNAIRYDLDGDGATDNAANQSAYETAFPGLAAGSYEGYELMNDLDFNGSMWASGGSVRGGWKPIGIGGLYGYEGDKFVATFEGNHHTIANLYIKRDFADQVGLFGSTRSGAAIRNLGVTDVDVTGDSKVGGLVGENGGTITASYSTGSVNGGTTDTDASVGGLVGSNSGTITASYSAGSATGNSYVGGLVGGNSGTITASYSTGSVMGNDLVGGLVGYNFGGTITASYSTGSVNGNDQVGGLVGYHTGGTGGTITASYSTGSVTGNDQVGGLVGYNFGGTITASYSTGSVDGANFVGGLVGNNFGGTITASYYPDTITIMGGDNTVGAQTASAMLTPVGYTGLYVNWNVDIDGDSAGDDPWDFGSSSDYPTLKGF